MKKTKLLTAIALAIGISTLAGCGGSSSTAPSPTSLLGSAFKGPIDQAMTKITDATGNELASATSNQGKFELDNMTLPTDTEAVFIETQGGSFTDEATGEKVTPSGGLMSVFTVAELKDIIANRQVIALTPETTLMATLVKQMITDGKTASEAIAAAKAQVQTQLIDGTSPIAGIPGDTLFLIGDLSAPTPADQSEALARNRSISFSYEAQTMNLTPVQVFELIEKRALDMQDGTLDGMQNGTTPITITDKDGTVKPLGADQKTKYALERTRLFNNTIARLGRGDLSDNELQALQQLGVDTDFFMQQNQNNQTAAANTKNNLAATDLPAFNHLPVLQDEDGDPTDAKGTYTLTAESNVNVTVKAPGESWITPMLRYNQSQLPPVIKAKRGDQMTLTLVNNLEIDPTDAQKNESTIHWHGFKIPGDQDGGPDFPVAAGATKTYSFPMLQPAASLWFHPHPDLKTGEQVYGGLAGVYLLDDAINQQLVADNKLPAGDYDIPIVFQGRRFKDDNDGDGVRELLYMDMEMDMDGMLGDKILVNGAVLPKLDVETRQYRLRLYNTSNARSFDFALSDGTNDNIPFKVIGTDGGLLPSPVDVDHIMLGVAERAEIVIDFSNYTVGDKLMLISKGFSGSAMMGMPGMGGNNMDGNNMGGNNMGGNNMGGNNMGGNNMGGNNMGGNNMGGNNMGGNNMGGNGMGGNGMGGGNMPGMLANGQRMDLMRFDVTTAATDPVTLYDALPANADINTQRLTAADADKTRNFVMTMAMGGMGNNGGGMGNNGNGGGMGGMTFVINGKTFDMNRIDELVKLADGDTEIWSIQNRSPMAHPFHAHAIQWQILSRGGRPATGVDLGWKDTVLVQPGETVEFIGRFDPVVNYGDYMYHCHILEHEDAGMMGFFRIE